MSFVNQPDPRLAILRCLPERPITLNRFADAVSVALALADSITFRVVVAVLGPRGRLDGLVVNDAEQPSIDDLAREGVVEIATTTRAAVVYSFEPVPTVPPEDRVHTYLRLRADAAQAGCDLRDWIMVDEFDLRSMAFTVNPATAWGRRKPRDRRRPRSRS